MKKMNAKDILVPTISLFVICLVATALLALVNNVTYAKIQQNIADAASASRSEVLPADHYDEVDDYYVAKDKDNNTIGYVFDYESTVSGYAGKLKVTVGVDKDGVITGIKPDDVSNETPGLGQNTAKDNFTKQFIGKSGSLVVSKQASADNEIQAVTSATISSNAITDAVNVALETYAEITQNGGAN